MLLRFSALFLVLVFVLVGCGNGEPDADVIAQAVEATLAAMPTSTPVATEVTQVVEVTREVTRVVEVEVLVTPTPLPATPTPDTDAVALESDEDDTDAPAVEPIDEELEESITLTQTVTVIVGTANVRAGPDTEQDIIGQVAEGEELVLLEISEAGDWYRVCCVEEEPGWLFAELAAVTEQPAELPVDLPAQPTPTPTPALSTAEGTRDDPVPLGQIARYVDAVAGEEFHILLTQVVRGQEAQDIINQGKSLIFASPRQPEHEFLAAYFVVEHLRGPEDFAVSISASEFSISVDNRLVRPAMVSFATAPELRHRLYPGGRAEGWVPFEIPEDGQVDAIHFSRDLLRRAFVWFAVE